MPSTHAALVHALAAERDAILGRLDGLPPEKRTTAPAPDAWSPLEVAEHVFRAERAMVRGLERQAAAGEERADVGDRSRTRVALLHTAMRTPKKIRVPEGAKGVYPEGMDYDALRTEWSEVARRLDAVVADFPASLSDTPLIRHPIAGGLTLADTLRFLALHAARHRRQLDRAIDAA